MEAKTARKPRKQQVGVVVSDRMQKTVVVRVETRRRHPFYRKTMRYSKTYKVHDESNTSRAGDTVLIAETRPMSKEKRWRVVRVLARRAVEPLPQSVAAPGGVPETGGEGQR